MPPARLRESFWPVILLAQPAKLKALEGRQNIRTSDVSKPSHITNTTFRRRRRHTTPVRPSIHPSSPLYTVVARPTLAAQTSLVACTHWIQVSYLTWAEWTAITRRKRNVRSPRPTHFNYLYYSITRPVKITANQLATLESQKRCNGAVWRLSLSLKKFLTDARTALLRRYWRTEQMADCSTLCAHGMHNFSISSKVWHSLAYKYKYLLTLLRPKGRTTWWNKKRFKNM